MGPTGQLTPVLYKVPSRSVEHRFCEDVSEDSANPAREFLRFELGGEAEGTAEATRVQQQAEPVAASDKSRRRGVQLARPPAGVIEQARDLGVVRLVREQVAAVSQQWPQVLQAVSHRTGQVGVDVREHELRVEPGQCLVEE